MRRRKDKFVMLFKNNIEINTLSDLRKNFDFRKIMAYFQSKKLSIWLEDRFYSDEADSIKAIKPNDKYAPQKICDILGVNYEDYYEDLDDAETVAWRQKRREYLQNFTDDPAIIKKVDAVAFTQEDLEDILRDSPTPSTIYLCGKFFRFPSGILRKAYIGYIGLIDGVKVKFETSKKINLDDLDITFENITITDEEPVEEEEIEEVEEEIEEPEEVEEKPQPVPINRVIDTKIVQASFIPASAITQTALRFKSRISLRFDGKTTDAKSIEMAQSRGLIQGQKVRIVAEGIDADDALAKMIELLEQGQKKNSTSGSKNFFTN